MNKFAAVFVSLLLLGGRVFAQDDSRKIDHTLAFPKGDAAWTVAFREASPGNGQDGPQNAMTFTKVEITRIGDVRRDVVTYHNGKIVVYWWPRNVPVVLWQEGQEPFRAMRTGYFQDRRYDESLFDWISKSTFKEIKSFEGKSCRIYRKEVLDSEGIRHPWTVWVDNQTLRPVAWSDGSSLLDFTFSDAPPSGPLALPDQARETLARCQAALAPPKRLGKESSR